MHKLLQGLVNSCATITVYVTGSDCGLKGSAQYLGDGLLELGSGTFIVVDKITTIVVVES
jgi:hypothetical protein